MNGANLAVFSLGVLLWGGDGYGDYHNEPEMSHQEVYRTRHTLASEKYWQNKCGETDVFYKKPEAGSVLQAKPDNKTKREWETFSPPGVLDPQLPSQTSQE